MGGKIEKEILEILEDAMLREKAAHKLYKRGEEIAEKEEMRKIFAVLADEELKHETLIRDMYYDFKKKLGLKILSEKDE